MTERELRQKIVSIAKAYFGCKESNGSHRKIIDIYNAHRPLACGYKVKYTDAWCSTFASAVAIIADMTDIIPTECSCERHIAAFKKIGAWQENDAYTPDIGDYIFYDWDDTGAGDCTGVSDHVGIVTARQGQTITVIEGNKNDAVDYRAIKVNARYIRGYGTPNYARKATAAPQNQTTDKTAATYIVVAGDTLSKIAQRFGTTVAALVEINGIHDPNKISVGQVIALSAAAAAAFKLGKLGVINSPDYWAGMAAGGTVPYLDTLLVRAAEKLTKTAAARTATPEDGIAALVTAGIINTPTHWENLYPSVKSLGDLLRALGGAAKAS